MRKYLGNLALRDGYNKALKPGFRAPKTYRLSKLDRLVLAVLGRKV